MNLPKDDSPALHAAISRERFRDPLGWLLDALPWRLRRLYFAVRLRERPRNIPDDVRIVGCRRPPEYVIAYFRRLHGLEDE